MSSLEYLILPKNEKKLEKMWKVFDKKVTKDPYGATGGCCVVAEAKTNLNLLDRIVPEGKKMLCVWTERSYALENLKNIYRNADFIFELSEPLVLMKKDYHELFNDYDNNGQQVEIKVTKLEEELSSSIEPRQSSLLQDMYNNSPMQANNFFSNKAQTFAKEQQDVME